MKSKIIDTLETYQLPRDNDAPGANAVSDDRVGHRSFGDPTSELSMKTPMSVSKAVDHG